MPGPPIVVQQHVIAPSQIVGRLFENELRVHVNWVRKQLVAIHKERAEMPRPGLEGTEAVAPEAILIGADASRRRRLEPYMDEVLDGGRRSTAFWTGTAGGYSRERVAYCLPSEEDVRAVIDDLLAKAGILFAGDTPSAAALDRHSMLLAQDSSFLALYANVLSGYPKATFRELFWPRVTRAIAAQWHCFSMDKQVLVVPAADLAQLGAQLMALLNVTPDGTFGLALDSEAPLTAVPLLVTGRKSDEHGTHKWKIMAALSPWLNVNGSGYGSDTLNTRSPLKKEVRQNW
jgi:hypothetical protein